MDASRRGRARRPRTRRPKQATLKSRRWRSTKSWAAAAGRTQRTSC